MKLHGITDFPIVEFAQRRQKVLDAIGSDAIALLQGSVATGDFDRFRQSPDFFYLCGVEVPHAYLLLDGSSRQSILYLPGHSPRQERSEGPMLNADHVEQAQERTGVDAVKPLNALVEDLRGRTRVYLPRARSAGDEAGPLVSYPSRHEYLVQQIQKLSPEAEIAELSPVLRELRMIKSPAEVELMREAGRLTALAVVEAMHSTRPGVMEYQLNAVADYVYLVNGARGAGYRAILGGGHNAWHGHYYHNDCPLQDGDLVLMDYAPDYGGYTSDIGRMWPVNGTYAPWQRELYGFMVTYHKALLARIRPGAMAADILKDAAEEMEEVLNNTRFSKPCFEEAARRTLTFRGHLSHTVGLHVHDGGGYWESPMQPGLLFSTDPQMWIPEEELYIRVEDTIVVTEDGIENLTSLAPLELDDVEASIRESGMLS